MAGRSGLRAASRGSPQLTTNDYASLVFLAPLLARPAVRVAWAILAVTVTLNIVAAAPPNQHAGSLIPVFGPIGTAGSVAMIVATIMVLMLLVRDDSGDPGGARPSAVATPIRARGRLRSSP